MKAKLTPAVRALANGAANDEERPILCGIHINEREAVVADGFLLVLTLPSTEVRGFSGYAQAIASRYRLTGLPDPKEFLKC